MVGEGHEPVSYTHLDVYKRQNKYLNVHSNNWNRSVNTTLILSNRTVKNLPNTDLNVVEYWYLQPVEYLDAVSYTHLYYSFFTILHLRQNCSIARLCVYDVLPFGTWESENQLRTYCNLQTSKCLISTLLTTGSFFYFPFSSCSGLAIVVNPFTKHL